MSMTTRTLLAVSTIGAALCAVPVAAADLPGAMPGDEALTCEQIYAQGMAESQKDQQERNRKNEERRKQTQATTALVMGAMATGGMGGTGMAANKSAEALADRTMADAASPPPSNLRMDRLKTLWAQKHCVKQ